MKTEFVMSDGVSNKNACVQETTNRTKSSPAHSTPVKQIDKKQRHNGLSSSIATGFNLLPVHITPPSGLTKFIARNPFDADLTSRLHLSVISPTVFTKVSPTERRDSPGFTWSVEELALIHPANIEEFPLQQMHSTDPDVEVVAQAAINKFFTDNQIIPSPWADEKKEKVKKAEKGEKTDMSTPSRPLEDLNLTRETHRNKKDCWSQTALSLPPLLPKQVEEALKPYLTFNQDQNVDNEDANSSNNSLRRKLFFNHDEDCTEDGEESSFCLSPSKLHASVLQSSPPQSGMLIHGTPLGGRSFALQRTHGTPYAGNLSPPNMSPICRNDMSCQSIRSRCQLVARLDFTTDMSIDRSSMVEADDNEFNILEDVEFETHETSMIRSRIVGSEPNESDGDGNTAAAAAAAAAAGERGDDKIEARNENAVNKVESGERTANLSSFGSIGRKENFELLKIRSDWCKIIENEALERNNTILGNSCVGQPSWNAHWAQDTGYQTRSMTNVTENTENFSISGLNTKSFHWNEKILSNGQDDIKLSDWKDNMKNMFSSTPSKYSRRKDD